MHGVKAGVHGTARHLRLGDSPCVDLLNERPRLGIEIQRVRDRSACAAEGDRDHDVVGCLRTQQLFAGQGIEGSAYLEIHEGVRGDADDVLNVTVDN